MWIFSLFLPNIIKNNPKVQENLLFLRNTSENAIYHDKHFFPYINIKKTQYFIK